MAAGAVVFSERRKRRLTDERVKSLRVQLNDPRAGLAIADGTVFQQGDTELIKCIWSDRECVYYAFCLDEVYVVDGSDGPVQHTREVYRDTKGIPFEIRDEYGVAKVNGELEPAASDFQTDWDHHNCPGRFEEVFWSLYQRSPKTRLRKKGTLRQRYTDLLPGQHVSVYGEMTVESDSQGQPEGCFLWNVKSSTKPNPDFDSLIYKPTSRRQSVEAIFGLLLIVVPVAYIFWRASQE